MVGYVVNPNVVFVGLNLNKIKMKEYITLEDLKDFDVWKSWKNGEVELEPSYTQEEVGKLLVTQRGNSYVAVLNDTKDIRIASLTTQAPEPWNWKKK